MPPRNKPKTQAPPVEDQGGTAATTAHGLGETNTGTLDVSAETGDGGAREIEVSAATERLEARADEIEFSGESGLLVAEITDTLVDLFRNRPKPWGQMSQTEQRDVIAALEHNAKELVRQVVEAVACNGKTAIRCLLVGFTDKGDDIKAELKVKALSTEETEAAVVGLHRARGKHVMLTVASADDYHDRPANDVSEPEQRGLGFEAGSDEVADEDLAAPDLEQPDDDEQVAKVKDASDQIATGDAVVIVNNGIGEARVNLKTGMVEALPAGADSETGWEDVREATPEELAAERERAADFADA